jgi:hypothetical protein
MLDEKEKLEVRNAMLTLGQERLRVADRINELVHQAIKLRQVEIDLELAFEGLARLVSKSPEAARKEIEDLPKEPL